MTNQHRVEAENVRLVGEAQEALRAREDLLAIVSHDLRNPLGVVLASTALLLKSNLPPDKQERARRQVEAIQRAGNRMNRLIRDLLDFASIQAGRLSVSKHPQDVAAMVNEVLEVTEPLAAAKSHRLVADVAPELAIKCDHDRVIQLFSNLVGNAVKFTPDGGTITVRAAPDSGIVRFSVTDTGPGIRPTSCRTSSIATIRRSGGTATASGWDCRSRAASSRRTAAASGPKARREGQHLLLHPGAATQPPTKPR